jgi:hypothetical protein
LQPDNLPSNGSLSPLQFGRPIARQITKNPQNIMQNFQPQQQPPQQQNNGFGFNSFNNPSGNGSGANSGGGVLPNSSSTSRLSSLMGNTSSAFDFGMDSGGFGPPPPREVNGSRPGFGSSGGGSGRPSNPAFNMMNNSGMNSGMPMYDRSISTFDGGHHGGQRSNSGFERQMSVPNNLSDQGKIGPMGNGFGGQQQGGPRSNHFTAASLVEVAPILPPTMAVDPDSTT